MKNFRYIIFAITGMLVFTSCDKELEINPEQSISTEQAVSTPENINYILIGAYATSGKGDLFGGDIQIYADLLGDSGYVSWYGTYPDLRSIYNKNIVSDNAYVRDSWGTAYKVIYQTNLILDNLNVITNASDKKRVEGEAKFLRALNYFELVRYFGKTYEAGQNNTQPGVPLVLTSKINFNGNLSIARNTVEEIYTQIIKDLTDAVTNLPSKNSFYADIYSAKALLARVYLQKGDYKNARDTANDVLTNSGRTLMSDYKDVFNGSRNTAEDLFVFQVTSQSGTNDLVTFYADEASGGRGGDIALKDDFIALFETDDVRGTFNYTNSDDDILTSKYTNQYGNISAIRLAEMYLIRAESNLREGTATGATPVDDVNEIRKRAKASVLNSVTLEDILTERVRELAFEGFLLHDIKRTKGNVGSMPWNDNKLVFPIPLREMQANPKLVQNPGYN
ncbi:RagB/SusD family nutrient uptake outer membrane protein [Elizabethkingia meningoseptica]|uniref:RagB/SusD family nutrient uptake outer membrane protein n=1 Tax=Elizabethkingia meningoseptica TaxID=238 RepID=UPI0023B0FD0E|nr:RagB/SusD family nutrient uptake outer membrane protein [Elizabethkingia meningoseptica]MDE5429483.1 RagB/SusD family nutrient uptake outer membrane protein [Elizabethkingia meningoseptica]